jgi:hypothetical protein
LNERAAISARTKAALPAANAVRPDGVIAGDSARNLIENGSGFFLASVAPSVLQ